MFSASSFIVVVNQLRVIVARKKLKKFIEIDMKALLKLFTRFSKIRNCCSSAKK